mmetsp:Transcript_22855/g.71745  ORF Transcript_22855/g.71745 Transcript_22855/m.71745 type:complete len:237 (-) Transcript_22855:90-800(-)
MRTTLVKSSRLIIGTLAFLLLDACASPLASACSSAPSFAAWSCFSNGSASPSAPPAAAPAPLPSAAAPPLPPFSASAAAAASVPSAGLLAPTAPSLVGSSAGAVDSEAPRAAGTPSPAAAAVSASGALLLLPSGPEKSASSFSGSISHCCFSRNTDTSDSVISPRSSPAMAPKRSSTFPPMASMQTRSFVATSSRRASCSAKALWNASCLALVAVPRAFTSRRLCMSALLLSDVSS